MARPPSVARRSRILFAGVPQHIIQRGNNRQATFFAVDDYHHYLNSLLEAAKKPARNCLRLVRRSGVRLPDTLPKNMRLSAMGAAFISRLGLRRGYCRSSTGYPNTSRHSES
jgi:hypothetical protein